MVKIKRQLRCLKKSNTKCYDFFQLLYAYLFRPRNTFICSKVKFTNRGKLKVNGDFYFGVLTNKLTASTNDYGVLNIGKSGCLQLENHVKFSSGCRVYINGLLTIGENTYINPNSVIIVAKEISIGSNCAISWNVQIMDTDIHTLVVNGKPNESTKKIKIGNNVWIGSNVIILKGTEIGNNVVIAAGSIVSGNIPDNVLIAGVPAKIVKEQISWLQ